MSSKNTAVFGIYATPGTAEAAVDHLLAKGFTSSAISVLLPDDDSTRAFAHEKSTKAPEGTAAGVTTGGVIGGTLGLLGGLGLLAIPGFGPIIAAGPIMAALAGLGAGGAVGGIVGALVGMGIPEYEAKRYEGAVKDGGTLLSVHCDTSEQIDAAKQALKETGAKDISSTGEAGSRDTAGARGTYGNISDTEPVSDLRLNNDVVVEDDRKVVDRDVVTGEPTTRRYGT
ncbi:MAG TPA: DUF3341 domain-containing protein [Silvibacterium sp.]|nr:DUF3341 domain-containing protein [Silvibacterium sp.]